MTDRYESPLSTRYASPYMLQLFSADTRYQTWRRLWVSLARAEMELGLPITQGQVEELEAHISEIDYDCVRRREKEVRHDLDPRLMEGFYRCLRTALQAMDLAQWDVLSLSFLDPLP